MIKTKWCVIQKTKTKTKSEFAVKINTVRIVCGENMIQPRSDPTAGNVSA